MRALLAWLQRWVCAENASSFVDDAFALATLEVGDRVGESDAIEMCFSLVEEAI